jgi:undecaprenyl-diphosphatase
VELTLIVAGLLAATAGLAVGVAYVLRAVAVHRHDLAAAGRSAAACSPLRRLLAEWEPLAARIRSYVAPVWFFSVSAVLGLSVIGLAAAVTGTVVEDVTNGDGVAVLDRPVAAFVAARRTGALTMVMREVSAVGGPVVLAVVTAAAGVLLAILRRRWGPAVAAAVTVAGCAALTVVFKQALGRPRPPLARAVAAADGYAFPSAHAAVAAAAFGVLAYLCAAGLRSWAGRVATWAAAAALAALVGISRVYLGVHWTTDVIGGWAFGACWAAVVITGWTTAARRTAAGRLPPRAILALPAGCPAGYAWSCAGVRPCGQAVRRAGGAGRLLVHRAARPADGIPGPERSWVDHRDVRGVRAHRAGRGRRSVARRPGHCCREGRVRVHARGTGPVPAGAGPGPAGVSWPAVRPYRCGTVPERRRVA